MTRASLPGAGVGAHGLGPVRPHADPGLQPERTVLSWGRTVLALDVVALMFLRWYPEVGVVSVLPAAVAALAGAAVMVRQRRRYADRAAGLAREAAEPAVGAALSLTGLVVALAGLGAVAAVRALSG